MMLVFTIGMPLPVRGYTALVAFGDSYTDTGNLPSSPPDYWNGRFSNGPLWVEDLSVILGFGYDPGNNFAVSGSESDELGLAIANFGGTTDSANVLFAIWSGNNDFANHLNLGTDDAAWNTRINGIVSSLMTASDLIYQKGARNIVLFNQLDVTRCPDIASAYSATFRAYIRGRIQLFNSRLAAAVPGLLNAHPGMQVFLVDIYSDFNYLLGNYVSLGFTSVSIGALDDPNLADKSFSGPGANYAFWDSQHPTAKSHALIAGWIAGVLPVPPPPDVAIASPSDGAQFTAPANLPVSVSVNPNGWNITQVNLYEDGALVSQLYNSPFDFTLPVPVAGDFTLTAEAVYGSGQVTSSPVQVIVMPPAGSAPPAPWNHQDIGSVGLPGSAYFSPDGTFTLSGSGGDIWGATDAFHYLFQPVTGDATFVACVNSLQNTDGFAKVGLMFRETLDPAARNALVFVTPSSGTGFQSRSVAGGQSTYTPGNSAATPSWIKLERSGTSLNGYSSADGNNWILLGSTTIPMSTSIEGGLAVTSHNNSLLNTAVFSNVRLTSPAAAVPPLLAIAPLTNSMVELTVTGAAGATVVIEASNDLTNWLPISTNLNNSGTIVLQQPLTGAGGRAFYRAFVRP